MRRSASDVAAFWAQVQAGRIAGLAHLVPGSSPDRAARISSGVVYLAAPHTPLTKAGQRRADAAEVLRVQIDAEMARLAACGVLPLCPALAVSGILSVSALVDGAPEARDLTTWRSLAVPTLACARAIAVPALPGWMDCPAVADAVAFGLRYSKSVHLYEAAR